MTDFDDIVAIDAAVFSAIFRRSGVGGGIGDGGGSGSVGRLIVIGAGGKGAEKKASGSGEGEEPALFRVNHNYTF